MTLAVAQDSLTGVWNIRPPAPHPPPAPLVLPLDSATFLRQPRVIVNGPVGDHSIEPAVPNNELFKLDSVQGLPQKLTIAAGVAKFNDRTTVRDRFDNFMQLLEAAEGTAVQPGATRVLHRIVADQMPATFDDSLYFHYGFVKGDSTNLRTFIDLHPGMRLRVDSQLGQLSPTPPTASTDGGFAFGYVPGGSIYCDIVEGDPLRGIAPLAFDAFLASTALPQVDNRGAIASGVVDLQSALRQKRWFRLCYPPNFLAADSAVIGDSSQTIAILGSDTLANLAKATDDYYRKSSSPVPTNVSIVFRGRVTVIPEIAVFANGAPVFVPVGTTVRQLVSRFIPVPRFADVQFKGMKLKRFVLGPTLTSPDSSPFRNFVDVSFTAGDPLVAGPANAFDLPLLAGDQCIFDLD